MPFAGLPIGWPLPAGPWRRVAARDGQLHACQMQLDTRRFVNGLLLDIDLTRSAVRWRAAGQHDTAEWPFSAFRCLRLMAMVPAEPMGSPYWRPSPKAVPYRVEFAEGGAWIGMTFSVAVDGRGFFACEPVDKIANLRLSFVPRQAYRSLQVGSARWPDDAAAFDGAASHGGPARAPIERAVSPRLGQVLVELGLINPQQLLAALAAQRATRGVPLGELLVRQGVLTREDLARALAVKPGLLVDANR